MLIALLQSSSACFTPLFQSLIPEILPDERDYTRALSLSRLAYDLESLLSPALAAILLTVITFHGLFAGTSAGFLLSAALVLMTAFPRVTEEPTRISPYARAISGMRIYLRTPRLQGLLALNLCAAAGAAMVFVNTVVIVRGVLQGGERQVGWALAAFGIGSMSVALLLPRLLDRIADRRIMLAAAGMMVVAVTAAALLWTLTPGAIGWATLLPIWALLGMAYAGLVTPGGRLLRRSAQPADLPSLFAAQFSLSHVCWLIAYPLAGWLGATSGLTAAWVALGTLALMGWLSACKLWPRQDPEIIEHSHSGLPADHAHLRDHALDPATQKHAHAFVIDSAHSTWPK